MTDESAQSNALELATELTIAWLSNPNTRAEAKDVPAFLEQMHQAVGRLTGSAVMEEQSAPAPEFVPAVSVRKSLASKDHIISLIDGKPYKALKRHLTTNGLTPAQYRERYGLRADYPMVSESYSETRRAMAKKIGLGRKPGPKIAPEPAPEPVSPGPAETNPAVAKKAAAKKTPVKPAGAKPARPRAAKSVTAKAD